MASAFSLVRAVALLAVLALCAGPSSADYIPFSGAEVAPNVAEIRVGRDGVFIQLEVYVGDIPAFEALVPDGWFKDGAEARPSQADRLAEFAKSGLTVRRKDGQALPVTVRRVEPRMRIDRTNALSGTRDPVTGRIFPKPPDDPRVLYAELFYDYDGIRPEVLTVAPPMTTDGLPVATIGMIVFDRDVPVTNFRYLSGPASLTVDWGDPWYSSFDNPNLRRHHLSGVTTYLYVEPREVRHETLIRVRDLDPWLSLGLRSGDVLSAEAQDRIKTQAAAFFQSRNPVKIDGLAVQPDSARAEVLTLDAAVLQIVDGGASVSADAAFVGVILSFPGDDIPRTVDVEWEMFNDRVSQVPATATDPAGPFLSGATPDDPTIAWTNHLLTYENPTVRQVDAPGAVSIPVLTVLAGAVALIAGVLAVRSRGGRRISAAVVALASLAAGGLATDIAITDIRNPFVATPDETVATEALAAILGNVSIAHLETTTAARTEELRTVVTEASLDAVASELDRALAIRVPGGGLARVTALKDLTLQNIAPVPNAFGFRALAAWSAEASAGHWGHNHRRDLRYRALVEVVEDAGAWKLDGITVLETRIPDA